MLRSVFKIFLVTLVTAFSTNVFSGIITNGSFEVGNFNPNSTYPHDSYLTNGSANISGWTVINDLIWIDAPAWGLTASNGERFLDLSEYQWTSPLGGIKQTIKTEVGKQYNLAFDLGSSSSWMTPSTITASAGAVSQDFVSTLTGVDNWETFILSFTATDKATEIKFEGKNLVYAYIGLDNVRMVGAVPEPSVLALFGIGFIGIGLVRHRQKK